MSFMIETRFPRHLTAFAVSEAPLQGDAFDCRDRLEKKFNETLGVR